MLEYLAYLESVAPMRERLHDTPHMVALKHRQSDPRRSARGRLFRGIAQALRGFAAHVDPNPA